MSSSSSEANILDLKLKARWEALLDHKIKPSEDGTCVVSIASMQYLLDELHTLSDRLRTIKEPSKKMLFDLVYGSDKKPASSDVVKIANEVPKISNTLSDLLITLQMSLPMVGYEEQDHLKTRIPPYKVILSDRSLWDLPIASSVPKDPAWNPCCAVEEPAKMEFELAPVQELAKAPAPTQTYDEEDLYA
jgi:hypothetical protein